jgi:hypothetical protein
MFKTPLLKSAAPSQNLNALGDSGTHAERMAKVDVLMRAHRDLENLSSADFPQFIRTLSVSLTPEEIVEAIYKHTLDAPTNSKGGYPYDEEGFETEDTDDGDYARKTPGLGKSRYNSED